MEKIKVAVVGTGNICRSAHMPAYMKRDDVEIIACADIDLEKAKKFAEDFKIPAAYASVEELLANCKPDYVDVCTWPAAHAPVAIAAANAGCHVMCEKPLAITREDLDAIVTAAEKANTVFMVGQICRFTPAFVKAKQLVDDGVIGELYYMESEYAHDYFKILHEWRADPNRHGVIGGGCHAVDLLRWFGGDVKEVFAYGTHTLLPNAPYDDATVALMKWSDRLMGKVFVSTGCKRPYTMRTQLWGSKGTILCDNTSDTMQLWTLGEDGISVKPEAEILPVDINNHNVCHEFDVFADHVLNGTPVTMTAEEGAKTVATCMAIVDSAKLGKPVEPDYNFKK